MENGSEKGKIIKRKGKKEVEKWKKGRQNNKKEWKKRREKNKRERKKENSPYEGGIEVYREKKGKKEGEKE